MASNRIDLTGKRFGRWFVIEYSHTKAYGRSYIPQWKCRCDCGTIKTVARPDLLSGHSKSCGCLRHELIALPKGEANLNRVYHRYQKRAKKYKEGFVTKKQFRAITKQNCHYCGAAPAQIKLSTERDNGAYIYNTLDRIDSDKGYELENIVPCCWACNRMKSNLSVEDFIAHIEQIHNHIKNND